MLTSAAPTCAAADLREVRHLEQANLVDAKVNDQTKWPDKFDVQAAGVVTPPG